MIARIAMALLAGIAVAGAQAPPNITVSWAPVTQYTDDSAITDPVTYNLYAATCSACPCPAGTAFTQIATGITGTSSVRSAVTLTVHGYTVTAVVDGVESDQGIPACMDFTSGAPVPAVPKRPAAPTSINIAVSP